MREVLVALNTLVDKGVIETYAIGGAVGAMSYVPSVATDDIDAFMSFPTAGLLLDISKVYSALQELGGQMEREYVRFGEWLLQVLPAGSELVEEAIREANATDYEGVPTRVFTAEHLCCIALEVGRPKDYLRIQSFLEEQKVDRVLFRQMATRYKLDDRLRRAEELLGQTI